tara:strand:- start:237 stop:971 length:735 start_codon:yes stop_codon:yes gene_type:complete
MNINMRIFVGLIIAVLFLICVLVLTKLIAKKNTIIESEESFLNSKEEEEKETVEYESEPVKINTGSHRRDSKIGSSLEFAYIDETCEDTVNDDVKKELIEEVPQPPSEPGPKIPMTVSTKCKPCLRELKSHTKNESNQSSDGTSDESSDESSEKTIDKNPDIMPHADLYDKYLEPQPNADSPYGFVFFPNKYWKQWQTKAPVCVPTSPCKVQPTCTNGVPVDVLDYTQVGSMMPKFEYKEEYKE